MAVQAQLGTHSVLITGDMTNSATQTANLDTRGADYATLVFSFAAEVNTNAVSPTVSLLEDDTTVVTNFATFDSNFEKSDFDLTAASCAVYHVDLLGRQRYLRVSVTTGTTTNDDIECHVVGVLTRKGNAPTGTADMADVAVIG
tara:strand:+ start:359 stop:790 length:432 start_codon:yes stop_codon:yes gene_type:complete